MAPAKYGLKTFFAFYDVQKYPPSLLFLCATIGPMLIVLSFIKNTQTRLAKNHQRIWTGAFILFCRSLLHPAYRPADHLFCRGHSLSEGMKGLEGLPFKFAAPGEGYSLGFVYMIWLAIVILMYPLCKWYDKYKTNHKEKKWLSYIKLKIKFC